MEDGFDLPAVCDCGRGFVTAGYREDGGELACNLKAWKKGWKEEPIGTVDREKLNPLGSSIAVGHPFAATGGRIVTTLTNEMKRREARFGLISICGAGGTAIAMILERD